MGHGERHRAQPVASGGGAGAATSRARPARDGRNGIRPRTAAGASTASPRSRAPSSTRRTSARPTCRAGRRRRRTRMLVRAADATHVYTGLDLVAPRRHAQARRGRHRRRSRRRPASRVPEFYAGDLFCPAGKTPLYLGQPVALLIFETRSTPSIAARLALRDGTLVRFGEETGPLAVPNYGAYPLHPRRRPDAGRAGRLFAGAGRLGQPGPLPELGAAGLGAARRARPGRPTPRPRPTARRSAPSSPPTIPDLLVLDREFETQSVDPMFLEPESGLAWYDSRQASSSSCSACSRPTRRRTRSRSCSAKPRSFKPARIDAHFAYVGGGFGGRDHTPFPLYVALAAMFSPGRPVRLAHDRYQQFQARHQAARLQDAHARSASTARRARSVPSRPTTCSTAAASPTSRPASPPCGATGAHRHLRRSEGRRHHRRAAFARRHRGLDARLRHAADA